MAVKDLRSSLSCAFSPPGMVTLVILLVPLAWIGQTRANDFIPPSNVTCACLGEDLVYTCTVQGGSSTVWSGTAFTCTEGEINLRHSNFRSGAMAQCIDGPVTIVGKSLGITNNDEFMSQLCVTVVSELNGTTVGCHGSDTAGPSGRLSTITVIPGPYQQVPAVMLAQANVNTLTFTWDSVDPTCPSISYESTTSGCGTCSTTTSMTTATATATCVGLQLPSMCTFSVRSMICGFTGMPSNTVMVAAKVPDPPQVTTVPVYSADTNILGGLVVSVDQQDAGGISNSLFGAISEYTLSYSGVTQSSSSCETDTCEYAIDGPFQDCISSSSNTISVSVSASNVFGQGNPSVPHIFGCTNEFVRVTRANSIITCTFLTTTNTSVKSCTVRYGQCGQELVQKVEQNSTTAAVITLQLDPGEISECFTVTARNDTFTARVDSRIMATEQGSGSLTVVIVATVIAIFFVITLAITVVLIIVVYVLKSKHQPKQEEAVQLHKKPGEPRPKGSSTNADVSTSTKIITAATHTQPATAEGNGSSSTPQKQGSAVSSSSASVDTFRPLQLHVNPTSENKRKAS